MTLNESTLIAELIGQIGLIRPIRPIMNSDNVQRARLQSEIQQVTEEFEQQMRARGFDPAQAENVALPASLAQLYARQQLLLEELEEIKSENNE